MFFATGAYTGYSPIASGTVGSLWGVPVAYLLSLLSPVAAAAIILPGIVISIAVASEASRLLGKPDPGEIVCDEIIGYCVAAWLIPFTLYNVIIIFILFRFFDILKPFPLRLIERRIPGGSGIVLDDVGAGIYANIAARLLIFHFMPYLRTLG